MGSRPPPRSPSRCRAAVSGAGGPVRLPGAVRAPRPAPPRPQGSAGAAAPPAGKAPTADPPAPPGPPAERGAPARGGAGGEREEPAAAAGWEAPRSAEPSGAPGRRRGVRPQPGRAEQCGAAAPGDYRLARLFRRGRRSWGRAAASPRWNSPERGRGEPWTAGGTVPRREPLCLGRGRA